MIVAVGSTNQVKVSAVVELLKEYPAFDACTIVGVSASSDVSEQPLTLEETIRGAKNRARNAHLAAENCSFSIGIEGGLMEAPGTQTGYLHITACAIFNGKTHAIGTSSGYEVPPKILALMLDQKLEMSHACLKAGITSHTKLGATEGLIGILSHGRIDRKTYIQEGLRLALVQLENPSWFSTPQ